MAGSRGSEHNFNRLPVPNFTHQNKLRRLAQGCAQAT